jgi:putative ABC transport system ATP-binding protein
VFDGVDVASLSDDAKSRLRNQKIGFIFQSFNLVPVLDAAENVELPLLVNSTVPPAERVDRVRQAIADVGLTEFVHHYPDKLSGGQRQRVAIARALAGGPRLILADEPTANLDSATARQIVDLMEALNQRKKVTFLFATHDETLMKRVSRIMRISDGVIADD